MLELKNVTKCFDQFVALDQVSLHVPKGSVYGLVGPNGAGKSTLLRCAMGIYRPTSGEITLEGEQIWENPKVKARMTQIPDDIFYYPNSTMKDMALLYRQMYPTFDRALYAQLDEVFRLPKGAIRRFSKGMQKQAAFQLAIATRPEMLILDEPVDGLDPVMRRQVWQILLDSVAKNKLTVLVSSHNLRELEDVCDHVGILDRGKVLLERNLSGLQENMVKLQYSPGEKGEPQGLDILHRGQVGKLETLVIRGSAEMVEAKVRMVAPPYYEILPLSLEEIFIYELGGVSDEIRKLVL
ncbi:MAG: ABC transporter ATP-binding protein [Ruminococcaceae bacterium]|nr:ABC transporter ATP-binding protein [Oscillospiraceae bacterium]